MKDKFTIGICGLGSIGLQHARAVVNLKGFDIVGYDTVPETALSEDLPLSAFYNDWDSFLNHPMDGVILASPTEYHAAQAKAFLKRRIALLIEKPMAQDRASALEIRDLALKNEVPVLVGYSLRHSSLFMRAKELLDQGSIGELVSFHLHLGAYETLTLAANRFNQKVYGRLFGDYSHEWDYLRWFSEQAVKRVNALASTVESIDRVEAPNCINALLQLDNGVSGTLHLDYIQKPGGRSCFLSGTEGTLKLDTATAQIDLIDREGEHETFALTEERNVIYQRQLKHFTQVIVGEVPPTCNVHDGLAAVQIADALLDSSRENGWIEVNAPPSK